MKVSGGKKQIVLSSMDVCNYLMLLLLRGNVIQVQPLCEVHEGLGSLKNGQSSWSLMG
jgi:hypothetical protein